MQIPASFSQSMRVNYGRATLNETDALPDPIDQFARWFAEAKAADIPEPNTMTLATVDATGKPSARIVLLKEAGKEGFVFYTNYGSRKGADLAFNPACLRSVFTGSLSNARCGLKVAWNA